MNEITILLAADADIQAAFSFYDEVQEGRGRVFLQHLDAAMTQLRDFPESAPIVHNPYRRLLVPGFPFGIFYSIHGSRVIIAGVLNLQRDPEAIRQRFTE